MVKRLPSRTARITKASASALTHGRSVGRRPVQKRSSAQQVLPKTSRELVLRAGSNVPSMTQLKDGLAASGGVRLARLSVHDTVGGVTLDSILSRRAECNLVAFEELLHRRTADGEMR